MTIKTQIRIHKFRSFLDPQIRNLPGSTNLESSRNHKYEIRNSRFYCILWFEILSDSIIWNGRKYLRKQKSIKKTDVQIQKQRNLLTFVKSTLNHQQKMWDWRRRIWRCCTTARTCCTTARTWKRATAGTWKTRLRLPASL